MKFCSEMLCMQTVSRIFFFLSWLKPVIFSHKLKLSAQGVSQCCGVHVGGVCILFLAFRTSEMCFPFGCFVGFSDTEQGQ